MGYFVAALQALCLLVFAVTQAHAQTGRLDLKDCWAIQSSAQITDTGAMISKPGYAAAGWYPATVPTTVLAALVANKVYPDPDFGGNLRSIPGMSYKIGDNFSNEDMPKDSPFRVPWWYRTEFDLPKPAWDARRHIRLNFHGINYRANIWMNGHRVATSDEVAGAFRRYEFDVTPYALVGERNALAVEVFAPKPNDLSITFVDWNPMPPDKDMGIWQEVFLTSSGTVTVRHAQVVSKVDPDLSMAHLTISAEVKNTSAHAVQGMLRGSLTHGIGISKPVTLAAGEKKIVTFTPAEFDQLNIQNPQLWWPYQMGSPNLQQLHIEFAIGDDISDAQNMQFGVAEITSELDDGHRLFKINGKNILIRGGGWTPDMMLRDGAERWQQDFDYVKGMNLNAVRLEGKLAGDDFFRLADQYGILVMAGWCCCDEWQKTGSWTAAQKQVATESLRDQAVRLRNHPSVLVWLNGSDEPPVANVEQSYLSVLKEANWPKPILSSATAKKTKLTGATGVKMPGPYDYVPPNYWTEDTRNGGAFGFDTETSPGAAIPPLESLKQMLPADHLWPIDNFWDYHAGGGPFKNVDRYTEALDKRYGPAKDLEDYVWKSQAMAYEGERAMFEAYGQSKYKATGVIQWMLNNGWPSIIWHLYDYYLRPGGGYFGTQRACEPIHAQYSYFDRMVNVVSSTQQSYAGLTLSAHVYDIHAAEKYSHDYKFDLAADAVAPGFQIPDLPGISTTYFLKLTLTNSSSQIVSSNFYWLSTKPDVLDWDQSNWYVTPESSYADFKQLSDLPPVDLKSTSSFESQGDKGIAHVEITNPGTNIAFLIRIRLMRDSGGSSDNANGGEVLPILWDDNYISLLPGEQRELTATYHVSDLQGAAPVVTIDGWNVNREK